MKKSWFSGAIMVLALVLASCGGNENAASSGHGSFSELELSENVYSATHIVEAEYKGFITENPGLEFLIFTVEDVFRGKVEKGEDIYVSAILEGASEKCREGESFLLFLQKNDMVFYEHPAYAPLGESFIPEEDSAYSEITREVKKLIKAQKEEVPDSYGTIYTVSEKISDVLDISDNIFVAKVVSSEKSELYPTSLATCETVMVLRSQEGVEPGTTFQVGLFDNTFEIGGTYVILMPASDAAPGMYSLSSRKAVYTLEEAEEIPELQELLAEQ